MTNNALEIHGLQKNYSGFQLGPVDLTVPLGSVVGLIGQNGSGKTTTLKAILNMIHTDGGSIRLLGMDPSKEDAAIKQHIGVVPDACSFHDMLNAAQAEKILKPMFPDWDSAYYWQLAEQFALPKTLRVKEYSKGMKTKLMLACALAHHPQFLLLDEPTSGLDPVIRSDLLDILAEFMLDERHAILLSSHITSDLEKIADYVVFLHHGKVQMNACMDDIKNEYGILKCPQEQLDFLEQERILSIRRTQFGCEALVKNRAAARHVLPQAIVDPATLEDIMTFTAKGEQR